MRHNADFVVIQRAKKKAKKAHSTTACHECQVGK